MATEAQTIATNVLSGGFGADPAAIAREITATRSDLANVTNPQDKLNLQSYLQGLIGQQSTANAVTTGTNNAASASTVGGDSGNGIPLMSAATNQFLTTNTTGGVIDKTNVPNIVADAGTQALNYVKTNIGNIGVVVLAVVVLGVALIAATKSGPQIIQAVKG